ncbi:hypothetical protein ILUMI_19261, partial [Ignelater luminosus]
NICPKRPTLTEDSEVQLSASSLSNEMNVGKHIDTTENLPDELKYNLLLNPWSPNSNYNFKNDVSNAIFCGTHDLLLRGKLDSGRNFADLLKFRIESGDKVLQSHLSESKSTEKYISVRVQNELINICGQIMREQIIEPARKFKSFAILADESADISGVEKMSLGIRYVDVITENILEEFLGLVPLKQLNAESIVNDIISFFSNSKLDLNKMVGQGYDGCSTMVCVERLIQSWPAVKTYFIESGEDCSKVVWEFVKSQENEVEDDVKPEISVPEYYLHFVHHLMSVFQKHILL